LSIPDSSPQGVVSEIVLTGPGPVTEITVSVDISHTYRGDLMITLISPEGFSALLQAVDRREFRDDVVRTYSSASSPALQALTGVGGEGAWRLHVADRLQRDTGTLNTWSLALDP
jgi:subtilisin-like proprotein convertase family protein